MQQIRTEAARVQGKGLNSNFAIVGTAGTHPNGEVNILARSLILVPRRPKEEVFKVINYGTQGGGWSTPAHVGDPGRTNEATTD